LDAGAMNEIVSGLRHLTQQTEVVGDAVGNISDKILIGDYDEAIATIEALLRRYTQNT